MKAFKGKTFVAPVEKERKEWGKYKEKMDIKFASSRGKISTHRNKPSAWGTLPIRNKTTKKFTFCDYFLLSSILILTLLFVFLLFSLVFVKKDEEEEV